MHRLGFQLPRQKRIAFGLIHHHWNRLSTGENGKLDLNNQANYRPPSCVQRRKALNAGCGFDPP